MNNEFKDALITFFRGAFATGIGAAITYVTGINLLGPVTTAQLGQGITVAFITGVLLFCGQYLRNTQSRPAPVESRPALGGTAGPHRQRTKVWADFLPI